MDLIKEAEAALYLNKAERSFKAGNFKSALEDYVKVADLYLFLNKVPELALSYLRIAECYHEVKVPLKEDEKKNFVESIKYYVKAAEKYTEAGDHLSAGNSYENASKISEELEDVEKAAEYASNSIVMYEKSGNLISTSHAYLHAAQYHEKLSRLDVAAENYEKAGKLDMQISDDRQASANYLSAAECYKKMEKFEKAIGALANSVSANLRLREYSKIADTYEEMADAYMKTEDFKNAVYYSKKAAELRFDNKNYAGAGQSYLRIGELHEKKQDFESALNYFKESAKISLEAKNFEQAALAYEKVAESYEKLSNTLKASEYYVYSAKTSVSAGKEKEASKTYEKAGRNFIDHAESTLIEKDYEKAALYYEKAAECFTGIGDHSTVGEIYVRKAGVHLKAEEPKKLRESYVLAAEAYYKADELKNSAYYYKMAEDYLRSASIYLQYAQKKSLENEDFEAGEGFKFAGRAFSKAGEDSQRRDSYNKAIFHYRKITKRKPSEDKAEIRVRADSAENIGESYIDTADIHKSEEFFQQAVELYQKIGYPLGEKLSTAFLSKVKGELDLELGQNEKAAQMFKNSMTLFDELIGSGKFNTDFANYLNEQKEMVDDLICKIELKPEIQLVVDKHAYAFTDTVLIINGVLSNNGKHTIKSVSFLSHLPSEFKVVRLPPNIDELKPDESLPVSSEITVKKSGEYVVKPFEIFYRDNKGNKYVKSSNDAMISVDERPPEDFKNFRLAVEVYSRYAKAQLSNKNFFYAGDGFKRAAEVYGKFNSDEHLKDYYQYSIDAYLEYTKSEPKETADVVALERMGDAYWNIAECYDAIGDLNQAVAKYKEALKHYEKSGTADKMSIGNAFISEIEAKKAIEGGQYSEASEKLSQAIEFFNEAFKKGGLDESQLKLIEKHNSEARMLIDNIKGTPVVILNVEVPPKVTVNKKFTLKAVLSNPGEIALKKIRFMIKVPESFRVESAPTDMLEAKPKSTQEIAIEIIAKKAGEYTFKPLDMFYTDEQNNSYMRGSNKVSMKVAEEKAGIEGAEKPEEGEAGEKPEVVVVFGGPYATIKDAKLDLKASIENKSPMTVSGLRFLVNAPPEFEVLETPEVIKELAGGAKKEISLSLMPRAQGSYTFKPIEIFYRDAHGNRFFKSSSEVQIKTASLARVEVKREAAIYNKLKSGLQDMKTSIVLVSIESEQHADAVSSIAGILMNEMGMGCLYISVSKPYEQLAKTMEAAKINVDKVLYIDCISHMAGKLPENPKNAVFIENPSSLEQVSMYVDKLLVRIAEPKFLMLDSLSTLLIYNNELSVEELTHRIINKMRHEKVGGIILSIKQKEAESLTKTLAPMCDKQIVL